MATAYRVSAETLWRKGLHSIPFWLKPYGANGYTQGVGWTTMVIHSEEQGLKGEGAWSYDEFHRWNSAEGLDLIG